MKMIPHLPNFLFLVGFLLLAAPLLGRYLYLLFSGKKTFLHPLLSPIEQGAYRLLRTNPEEKMTFGQYAYSLCLFHVVGFIGFLAILLLQNLFFLSPQLTTPPSWAMAINIAISFLTNTNWQSYLPETTLTNETQMLGLMVQQFLSPAVGLAATLALMRGIISRGKLHDQNSAGNFWVDLIRSILYLLLPLSLMLSVFLLQQGSVATYQESIAYTTLEGKQEQVFLGPVAAQTAIMHLGTNGGGFFNANSAHPFINPTDTSNILLILSLLFIPAAIPNLYGEMIGNRKEGFLLFACMLLLWLGGSMLAQWAQHRPNPFFENMQVVEGQETRTGPFSSVLWSTSTTATANGSVNANLDSLAPATGGFLLINLMLGETLFGGIGVGLCSLLFFVLVTLFLSGLMIGRSAEYQGKKIGRQHMQWVMCALLLPVAFILLASSLCILLPDGLKGVSNLGPHAFTSLFYAMTSCSMNNGSAFTSFTIETNFHLVLLSCLMIVGRMTILLSSLALGRLFSNQVPRPSSNGTFSTSSPLFFFLLTGILITFALLSFFPAWILGPFSEQVLLDHGILW